MKIPTVNLIKTGQNIKRLRVKNQLTVNDVKDIMGFDSPQAIYKWQWGECLPSVDNLLILSRLFNTSIEGILVLDEADIPFYLLNNKFNDINNLISYNDIVIIWWLNSMLAYTAFANTISKGSSLTNK